ncbi:MAG: NYN domain-containing protein [Methylophilaceae bacterium]|nr:NYN domain-containing protein [Methylophilaceae bacterium]
MSEDNINQKLAVLIDADNAQPAINEMLFAEIAKFGTANVKRIYGDWTTPNLGKWKEVLLHHSIQPIQQFRYTTGKNATDSALIIDAMDLLYTRRFDGFCIVSSDSDFTRLASRIREEGLTVYGFGERKTPSPFVAACDRFIYTEVLSVKEDDSTATTKIPANKLKMDTKLTNLLRDAVEASSDESGWALMNSIGSYLAKQAPDFDPRNYGYQKLTDLATEIQLFDVDKRTHSNGTSYSVYLKDKRKISP